MNSHKNSEQPHFSAFAIMILVLLLVFAFISKINILLDNSNKDLKPNNNSKTLPEYSFKERLKNSIAKANKNLSEKVQIPVENIEFKEQKKKENNKSVIEFTDKDKFQTDKKQNNYPIVPNRPKKGDKLGSNFVAVNDYIPAEKKSINPANYPANKTKYRSAPSVERIKLKTTPYKFYILRKNDTLWKISAKFLGEGKKWKLISVANPDINPAKLIPGQKIRIPINNSKREMKLSMVY